MDQIQCEVGSEVIYHDWHQGLCELGSRLIAVSQANEVGFDLQPGDGGIFGHVPPHAVAPLKVGCLRYWPLWAGCARKALGFEQPT